MSRSVQTVEQTGKLWKAGQGCGCLTMIVGIVGLGIFFAAPVSSVSGAPWFSMAIAAVGIGVYLFSRVMAWWLHG